MLKFIVLLVFIANLNSVFTDSSPTQDLQNDSVEQNSSAIDDNSSQDNSEEENLSSDDTSSDESVQNNSAEEVSSSDNEKSIRKKCGPNQVFEICPSTCPPRTCKTKDIAFRCKEPLKPGHPDCPRPRCRCVEGYYSNDEGKCVLKKHCPVVCKENEQYEKCPDRVCREKSCKDLGYPLACRQSDIQNVACGRAACICKPGFVRNDKGICIPSRECPSCGGDPNAWSGCGVYCTRCSNYKSKNQACILPCRLNSCDCRPGYVYDENKKKCVLPGQCPCKCNEVRSDCANNPCNIEYCSDRDRNKGNNKLLCKPNPASCKSGCVCAKGYLRAENGTCIPQNQCPRTCGPLEVYSKCSNAGCDKKFCSQVAQPDICIDVIASGCIGGCVCKSGYLRNKAGNCVPTSKCPSKEVCPKPHEYYDLCPPGCPPRKCGINDLAVLCKPVSPDDKCIPGCRCEQGYYRSPSGKCVTFEECPDGSCYLPAETGPCRAAIPKYYFDSQKNDCILFTYGGCEGNDNKYDTKAKCLAKCFL